MARVLKGMAFIALFWVLCLGVRVLFRDDANAYSRILMHELHSQENIDFLFLGASHVSHGIHPEIADARFGKSTFCTGTPSQQMDGTYAMLREAASLYRIERAFLEMDFASIKETSVSNRHGFTSTYLVSDYLKNRTIKYDYLFHASPPRYYLNSLLPIGKDKLIDLNPAVACRNILSRATGEYYKYQYAADDSEYVSKGCVLNYAAIENGTFVSGKEYPIAVQSIHDDWKNTVMQIIAFCREHDIQLTFYSNPSTDFYLTEKGNYDEWVSFLRAFLGGYGYDYYDFSLCKAEYLDLQDEDYSDDNHLNISGIPKFTEVFCDFFTGKIPEADLFYATYAEKSAAQPPRIYGLILDEGADKRSLDIIPVTNYGGKDDGRITYDVYAVSGGTETLLAGRTTETHVAYPQNSNGTLRIFSYFDGVQHNHITKSYSAL